MRGSRLPRKMPARRKAAATRLQSAWRARPARRAFLTARTVALKAQAAWLIRLRARDHAADTIQRWVRRWLILCARPPMSLGMGSAARHRACHAAITNNLAMLWYDGGGICVHCHETSPFRKLTEEALMDKEDFDWIDDRGTHGGPDAGLLPTAVCLHCGIDAVLPFRALPRDPIERRVLLRWCHNDRFLTGQTSSTTIHFEERMIERDMTPAEARDLLPDPAPAGPGSSRHWRACRELQRAGRYVLFVNRLRRAWIEGNERRYAPGSVGETEAMLSFRAAAAAAAAAGAAA